MILIWPNSATFAKPSRINLPYHLTRMFEVADFLEKNGVDINIFDMELNLSQFVDIIKQITQQKEKVIAFYSTTENLPNVIKYSDIINEIDKTIIQVVYGEVSGICPKYFIKSNIYGIISKEGDPEITLLDLYNYVNKKIPEKEIRGLIKNDGKQLTNLKKGEYLSPSEWGYPSEKYFDYEDLKRIGRDEQITFTITKGCNYNCNYCLTKNVEGNLYRKRPIENIIQYINLSNHKVFKFFSALFTFDKQYVKDLCRTIIKNKKEIKWSCCTRADLLNDEEMIELMAKSGCYKISVGVESLSDKELSNINKKTNSSRIIDSIKLVHKYGIIYKALIMIGIPNQTREELYNTIDILTKYKTTIRPSAYTPLFNINEDMNEYEITRYDKYTYFSEFNKNITYRELLLLMADTSNYPMLLKEGEKNDNCS